MKTVHYLFILTILAGLSCSPLEENSRPATEITTTSSGGQQTWPNAPAYITPPCNYADMNTRSSDILNFQIVYDPPGTVTLNNNLLRYHIENTDYDEIDLYIYPFVQNKSTVYTLTTSASSLKNYQAFIQVNGNSLDLYNKLLAKSMSSPVSYIYQEYNSSSRIYTLRFCDALFSYDFLGSTKTSHISGTFSFTY